MPDEYDEVPELVKGLSEDDAELSPHSEALMTTSSLASSPGSRFHSLTEEAKLTAPGEGKSLPFGGFHALCKNEEACSITLTHISALNAAACGPEPVSSD